MLTEKQRKDRVKETWLRDRSYLTSYQLKLIAIVTMLLSHIAQTNFLYQLGTQYWKMADIFVVIGRIAMPIFCFLISQGIIFTSDRKKYIERLFIFALISEIPFDLAISGQISMDQQNVFFTLGLGALATASIEKIRLSEDRKVFFYIEIFIVIAIAIFLSIILKSDYSHMGIIAILLIYFANTNKVYTAIAMLIAFAFEFYVGGYVIPVTRGVVYLSIPLVMLYNGKLGRKSKWFFYLFYPGHLLVLYLLKLIVL